MKSSPDTGENVPVSLRVWMKCRLSSEILMMMNPSSSWWIACARKARGLGTHAARIIVDYAVRKQ